MASTEWLVESVPPRPTVQAIIQTDSWQMTTETNFDNSNLSILQGSWLILLCTATYPVLWVDQNQQEIPQNRTYNPYLEEKVRWGMDRSNWDESDFDQYSIRPIERYEANLTIRDFTPGMIISCINTDEGSRRRVPGFCCNTIRLDRHHVTNHSDTLEFLQGTFDRIRLLPTPFFRYLESRNVISAVYTVPPGSTVNVSVDTSDSEILVPINRNGTSSDADLPDMTVETKQLTDHTHLISLIINRGSYFHKGDYDFIIHGQLADGTEVTKRQHFFLHLDVVDFSILPIEQFTPANWSALLTMDDLYVIRMYTQSAPSLNTTRLIMEERVQYDEQCRAEIRPWKNATRICGLLGFSLFNENDRSPQVGIQIVIQARSPCVYTVYTEQPSTVVQSTAKHISMVTVKSSLFTTTMNTSIPGMLEKGAAIFPGPSLWRDKIAYTNETLSFHCYVPICHLFYLTWMKKDDNGSNFLWPPQRDNINSVTGRSNETTNTPGVTYDKIRFRNGPSSTRIFSLTINSLQIINSGKWICGYFSPSPKNQHLTEAASIKIQVEDPVKPYFLDGKQFDVQEQTIPKGSTTNLFCNFSGNPTPDIVWLIRKQEQNGNEEFENITHTGTTLEVEKPGVYICNISNKYGENNRTFQVHYSTEQASYVPIAIALPIAVAVLCALVLLIWWLKRRAREAAFRELSQLLKNPPEQIPIDDTVPLNDQAHFIPYNRTLEINRDLFTIMSKVLGEGEFGFIFKGELKMCENSTSTRFVAIKTPRDPSNLQHFGALVDEMKVMCHIRPHVNVVALIGACTEGVAKKQLFVLTEYCENGSLKDYLIQNRMKFEGFSVNDDGQFLGAAGAVEALLKYSYQAANGMTHLSAEKIIHRDLALRNLLLTANHIVKIADFGLSRQRNTFYRPRLSKDTPLPVFWMAPEALFNARYTQKSDIWSFGVVLWEMFSCGRRPYPDHYPDTNFLNWLRAKEENRMRPPNIACEEIYDLMRQCWKSDPNVRPTFSECKRIIARTLEHKSPSMYQSTLLSLSEAWLSVSPENTASSSRRQSADTSSQSQSTTNGQANPTYMYALTGTEDKNIYVGKDNASEAYTMTSLSPSDAESDSPKGVIPYVVASEWSEYSDGSNLTYNVT